MYRVIVVDDEPLVAANVRAALEDLLDRFPVVSTVSSGKEALKIIEEMQPEIVITDIIMPGMSGIDLIRECSARFPAVRFVIVSGYAEFEYAQAALECGAVAYCLKPLQDEDLQKAVMRAARSFQERRDSSAELLEALTEPEYQPVSLAKYLSDTGFLWTDPGAVMVFAAVGGETPPLSSVEHLCIRTGKGEQMVLAAASQCRAVRRALEEWQQTIPQKRVSIGFGGVAGTIGELTGALQKARNNAYRFFTTGQCAYYDVRRDDTQSCEPVLRLLEQAISDRDAAAVERQFQALSALFASGAADMEQAFLCYNTVNYFLSQEKSDCDYRSDFENLARLFPNAEEMCRALCRQTLQLLVSAEQSIRVEERSIKNETIRAIVAYLNENFWKELNIQGIAEQFFVNMSYLCQIFKKETGHTMMEYISSLRIEQACALIRNSTFSVSEICEKVGYVDYCHFNKVFRRVTGKSPLQYCKETRTASS